MSGVWTSSATIVVASRGLMPTRISPAPSSRIAAAIANRWPGRRRGRSPRTPVRSRITLRAACRGIACEHRLAEDLRAQLVERADQRQHQHARPRSECTGSTAPRSRGAAASICRQPRRQLAVRRARPGDLDVLRSHRAAPAAPTIAASRSAHSRSRWWSLLSARRRRPGWPSASAASEPLERGPRLRAGEVRAVAPCTRRCSSSGARLAVGLADQHALVAADRHALDHEEREGERRLVVHRHAVDRRRPRRTCRTRCVGTPSGMCRERRPQLLLVARRRARPCARCSRTRTPRSGAATWAATWRHATSAAASRLSRDPRVMRTIGALLDVGCRAPASRSSGWTPNTMRISGAVVAAPLGAAVADDPEGVLDHRALVSSLARGPSASRYGCDRALAVDLADPRALSAGHRALAAELRVAAVGRRGDPQRAAQRHRHDAAGEHLAVAELDASPRSCPMSAGAPPMIGSVRPSLPCSPCSSWATFTVSTSGSTSSSDGPKSASCGRHRLADGAVPGPARRGPPAPRPARGGSPSPSPSGSAPPRC
jgi:hypothetical protein